jgi:hypothetical protein
MPAKVSWLNTFYCIKIIFCDLCLDIANKPKEADEWYKQALERARNIAKNLGQSSNTSSVPNQDASNPKLTDNAIPSKIYNKQEVKHEPGMQNLILY